VTPTRCAVKQIMRVASHLSKSSIEVDVSAHPYGAVVTVLSSETHREHNNMSPRGLSATPYVPRSVAKGSLTLAMLSLAAATACAMCVGGACGAGPCRERPDPITDELTRGLARGDASRERASSNRESAWGRARGERH
jgi:hypothetical protein